MCSQIILTFSTNTPFLYTLAIFHLSIFAYNHPNNQPQKHFPSLSQIANSGLVKGPFLGELTLSLPG